MVNLLFNKKKQKDWLTLKTCPMPALRPPSAKSAPGEAGRSTLEQCRSTKIFAIRMRRDAAGMFMGLLHLAMAYTLARAGHFAERA